VITAPSAVSTAAKPTSITVRPSPGLNPPGSGLDPDSNDFLGFSPNSDTHGSRHVTAAYVEAIVPLVGGKLHGFRWSRNSRCPRPPVTRTTRTFGDTTKPKFG
jgi:hypothetical protein